MNSPFPQLGPQFPTISTPFFVAPSENGTNCVVPTPASLVPLIALAREMRDQMQALSCLLNDEVPRVLRDVTMTLAGVRAIAGIADGMADSLAFRPQLLPDIASKCRTFRDKAHDLMSAAFRAWSNANANVRKLVPRLDDEIRQRSQWIIGSWRDSTNVAYVKAFVEDESVPAAVRFVNLWSLMTLETISVDLVARSEMGDEAERICREIFDGGDTLGSVPAIIIARFKGLWDAFVSVAAASGGTVGNLPAPDSLSVALLKVYGGLRLPRAALSTAKAGSLEAELTRYLIKAVKLTPAQEQELRTRMDELKRAQAEVIRTRKAQARDANTFGPEDHLARQARKARQRDAAEAESKQKAKTVSEFYRNAYGPKNEELYAQFQRGLGLDLFCSVLAMIQLAAAYRELDDPDVSDLQKAFDISVNGILSLGAVVSTVGRALPEVDLGVARVNLAAMGRLAEGLARPIAVYASVAAIVAGATMVFESPPDDPGEIALGTLTMASGLTICVGTILGSTATSAGAAAGAAVTGVGVGISVLLAGYAAFRAFVDAVKPETEKSIESILAGLEKNTTFPGKLVISYLDAEGAVKAARNALNGWTCLGLLPNPQGGEPTSDGLVQRMLALGFKSDDAKQMIEDANMQPPMLLPMTF